MKGEWCYFDSYLDKQTCEDIITMGKSLPMQQGILGLNSDTHTDDQVRRSQIAFINNGDWRFQDLFDNLWKTMISANHDFFNVHVTKLDFIQFAEYSADYQGEYKEHHDVFWVNDDPTYHRKLSCIIQLSDPTTYEGGNFEITGAATPPGPQELRNQGSVIYFPSFLPHKANPVTRGVRYSIAAWFEGPKWR